MFTPWNIVARPFEFNINLLVLSIENENIDNI